jgi:hypothetical protein
MMMRLSPLGKTVLLFLGALMVSALLYQFLATRYFIEIWLPPVFAVATFTLFEIGKICSQNKCVLLRLEKKNIQYRELNQLSILILVAILNLSIPRQLAAGVAPARSTS